MFTGIVSAVGQIVTVRDLGPTPAHGRRVTVEASPGYLADVAPGDSISINGACMTAGALDAGEGRFSFDVSAESLARTVGLDAQGPVNLEKALRASDRLGGHLVSGHVDGVATVARFASVGESIELQLDVDSSLARYLAYKGSVAIDGVSLTVNAVQDGAAGTRISINLIPHTIAHTALGRLHEGARVNLEVDTIARYVERMLASGLPLSAALDAATAVPGAA